jgi:hypothetical protein
MRSKILLLIFNIYTFCLFAQNKIVVIDKPSGLPLPNAVVANKQSKLTSRTNDNGICYLPYKKGDTLLCSHDGFYFSVKRVYKVPDTIFMNPVQNKLQEVEVKSPYAKYYEDSAARALLYRKTIKDAKHKPQMNMNNGIAFDGVISELAYAASGKKKKNKAFVKQLEEDNKQRYIALRYNKETVEKLTGLKNNAAILFIQYNPMQYDFARAATDLEIQMWVRHHFDVWKANPSTDSLLRKFEEAN